jgi:hypothetical protein
MSAFLLTGQTPRGFRANLRVDDRDIAERLIASWMRSGFTDVEMKDHRNDNIDPLARRKRSVLDDARRARVMSVALIRGLFSK